MIVVSFTIHPIQNLLNCMDDSIQFHQSSQTYLTATMIVFRFTGHAKISYLEHAFSGHENITSRQIRVHNLPNSQAFY